MTFQFFDEFGTFPLSLLDVDFDIKFSSVTTKTDLLRRDVDINSSSRENRAARKLRARLSPLDVPGAKGHSRRWEFSNIFSYPAVNSHRGVCRKRLRVRASRRKRGYEIWTTEFRLALSTRPLQISLATRRVGGTTGVGGVGGGGREAENSNLIMRQPLQFHPELAYTGSGIISFRIEPIKSLPY